MGWMAFSGVSAVGSSQVGFRSEWVRVKSGSRAWNLDSGISSFSSSEPHPHPHHLGWLAVASGDVSCGFGRISTCDLVTAVHSTDVLSCRLERPLKGLC